MAGILISNPPNGVTKLNGTFGNVEITSDDGSLVITPDIPNKKVDLSVSTGADFVLRDVPCDESVYLGAWVRIDSSDIAWNAMSDIFGTSHAIGLVEYKSSSTLCDIRCAGLSSIVFVGLNPEKDYYLSDTVAGGMQTNIPVGAGKVMLKLGQPLSSTKFVVQINQRVTRS